MSFVARNSYFADVVEGPNMTTDTNTIKTRLCILSDTHDVVPKPPRASNYAYREPFPSSDVLLQYVYPRVLSKFYHI